MLPGMEKISFNMRRFFKSCSCYRPGEEKQRQDLWDRKAGEEGERDYFEVLHSAHAADTFKLELEI